MGSAALAHGRRPLPTFNLGILQTWLWPQDGWGWATEEYDLFWKISLKPLMSHQCCWAYSSCFMFLSQKGRAEVNERAGEAVTKRRWAFLFRSLARCICLCSEKIVTLKYGMHKKLWSPEVQKRHYWFAVKKNEFNNPAHSGSISNLSTLMEWSALTRPCRLLTIFLCVNTFKERSGKRVSQSYLHAINLDTLFFPHLHYSDFIFKRYWKDVGTGNMQVASGQVRCGRNIAEL